MRTFKSSLSATLTVAALAAVTEAHMSIWTPSMYGVGGTRDNYDWTYAAGDPVAPLGPGIASQDDWWFRGPAFRALSPPAGAVTELPAGGSIVLEISCHIAWTSFGWSTSVPGSALDACPYNPGAYHAGENILAVDPAAASGCALGIANVDDINETTMDNIAIFSVLESCVLNKENSFDIPAMMPACTGEKCICGWFWLTNWGAANFYMTAFDCNVTNVSPDATAISSPLVDAVHCASGDSSCTPAVGAKRPLYAYNAPTNIVYPEYPYVFNFDRPGYHSSWGWANGAQNDIFAAAAPKPTASSAESAPFLSLPWISLPKSLPILHQPDMSSALRSSTGEAAVSSPRKSYTGPQETPFPPEFTTGSPAAPTSLESAARAASIREAAISSRRASYNAIQATRSSPTPTSTVSPPTALDSAALAYRTSTQAAAINSREAAIASRRKYYQAIEATKTPISRRSISFSKQDFAERIHEADMLDGVFERQERRVALSEFL